jgi:NADH-quinone oxidoreductase subunit N
MISLLPLLFSIFIYLFKENENETNSISLLLFGLISIFFIYSHSLGEFSSNTILMIFFITFLTSIWIDLNQKVSVLGGIFLFGAICALSSSSILSLFISIEILSLTMIILVNLFIQDQYPGILYYVFSGLFSALFILSLGYLSMGYYMTYKLLYIVFFYKMGLAPFHILLPQLYNNLSPRLLFLMDIPYKTLLFMVFYRLHLTSIDLTFIIIITLLIGSIGALRYKNLLAIMIYSSLYNYGLILISIMYQNFAIFMIYIIIYNFSVIIYLYLLIYRYMDYQINNIYYLLFWSILLFNLMGIPPFSGFFTKFFILTLSLMHSSFFLFFIISLGILFLTYTYLRLLISMMINSRSFDIQYADSNHSHLMSTLLILSSFPIFL